MKGADERPDFYPSVSARKGGINLSNLTAVTRRQENAYSDF